MSCSFNSCNYKHYAKGYCIGHWKQAREGKSLTTLRLRRGKAALYSLSELLSFTEEVDGCLVWKRADNKQGYGIAQHGGKSWMAHRLSYHLATGCDIGSQVIHHTCANSMCIKPEHLQLAHQADNVLEMLSRRSLEARIADLEARVAELELQLDTQRMRPTKRRIA